MEQPQKQFKRKKFRVIDKAYQFKYLLYHDTWELVLIFLGVFLIFFLAMNQILKGHVYRGDESVGIWSGADLLQISLYILVTLCGVFILYRTLIRSHQIAGPFVRFQSELSRMGKGDYRTDVNLRKGDRLDVLAKAFTETKSNMRELISKNRAELLMNMESWQFFRNEVLKENLSEKCKEQLENFENQLEKQKDFYFALFPLPEDKSPEDNSPDQRS